MRPLRVAVLSLSDGGGMAHYASQLSASLSAHVKCAAIVGAGARDMHDSRVTVVPIDLRGSPLVQVRAIVRALREFRPDVVHITAASYVDVLLWPFLRRYPLVVTVHDVKIHPGERTVPNVITNAIHKRMANQLVVHGQTSKGNLVAAGYSGEQITVIAHGNYNFLATQVRPLAGDEKRILFFGRILPYKGLDVLLKAFHIAATADAEVELAVVGKGDLRPYRELLNHPRIIVQNGFIPDDELSSWFNSALAVVVPYREGTQSGVIMLAYGYGRPVVATSVGDIPDVVVQGHTGFLVNPEDAEAIASKILLLRSEAELVCALGRQAREFASEALSWDSIARRTVEVYLDLIRRGDHMLP